MGILVLLLGYDSSFYWILGICKEVSPTTMVWLFRSLYWIPYVFKEVSLPCLVGVRIFSSIWVLGIVWLTALFNWYFLGSWLSLKDFILCMHTLYSAKSSRRPLLTFLELFLSAGSFLLSGILSYQFKLPFPLSLIQQDYKLSLHALSQQYIL